jgi:hypothetical protein
LSCQTIAKHYQKHSKKWIKFKSWGLSKNIG